MAAVIEELKQYQGSIVLQVKTPQMMPPYDPLVYYAGRGVDRRQPFRPVVWTIADQKAKGYEHALIRAYIMGVMETGEAGPKFQKAYEIAAGEDEALPSGAPDLFLNRHALVEPYAQELISARHAAPAASPSPTATSGNHA